jgi:uncharacterized protein (DUF302 family)
MEYGKTIMLEMPFEDAVPRVKAAFKEQGFGILTDIDIKATLKEKIDVDVDPYIILGACNPDRSPKSGPTGSSTRRYDDGPIIRH